MSIFASKYTDIGRIILLANVNKIFFILLGAGLAMAGFYVFYKNYPKFLKSIFPEIPNSEVKKWFIVFIVAAIGLTLLSTY
jgi:hypothetical protein